MSCPSIVYGNHSGKAAIKSVGVRTTITKREEALKFKGFHMLYISTSDSNMTLCAAQSCLCGIQYFCSYRQVEFDDKTLALQYYYLPQRI